ncbi:hypothetical protein LguiB_014501 [Lonicera macranthoides]
MTDNHMVVAALIATVAFTAGFTMPGGYIQSGGQYEGMAVLSAKSIAFRAFIISDTIALIFSTSALFIYFTSAFYTAMKLGENNNKLDKFLIFAMGGLVCNMFGLGAMIVAFITGTYAVLQHALVLAIATYCSFLEEIDFSVIDRISHNPKLVHVFNEHIVELEPLNSIQNNFDGYDRQSSNDTIIAVPLDSHYNDDDNPDRGECNPHNGEQHLVARNPNHNSIKNNLDGCNHQSCEDTIIVMPLYSHYDGDDNPDGSECNPHNDEQHLLASNLNPIYGE